MAPPLADHRNYSPHAVSAISRSRAVYCQQNPLLPHRNAPLGEPTTGPRSNSALGSIERSFLNAQKGSGLLKRSALPPRCGLGNDFVPGLRSRISGCTNMTCSCTLLGCRFDFASLTATYWSGGIVHLLFNGSKFHISFIYVIFTPETKLPRMISKRGFVDLLKH